MGRAGELDSVHGPQSPPVSSLHYSNGLPVPGSRLMRMNWTTTIVLALFHAGALAALFLFSWPALWVSLALLWISGGWGIGMGYHRLLTHRGYVTPKWMEYFLTLCATLALQGGPLFWVAAHRKHHRHADRPGDPHSPRDGRWWSHAGWLTHGETMPEDEVARYVPDLKKDRFYCFVERWHFVPMLFLIGLLWVWGVHGGGGRLAASLITWGVFLRTTVALHGTWLVNSASHGWGTRRFATPDDSTNNWWVALITFGEGWHNNHHADPVSVRHGIVWYELDVNWLCITMLSWVGLAKKVRLPKRT